MAFPNTAARNTPLGTLSNASFASASDVSLDDSVDGLTRQQPQKSQQPRRRRKSDLHDGELTAATELKYNNDNSCTTSSGKAHHKKANQLPHVNLPISSDTSSSTSTFPKLPSARDQQQLLSLRLHGATNTSGAETSGTGALTSPKDCSNYRRNTGSAKCAPVAAAGGNSPAPAPSTTFKSSNALKNFEFSPILQQRTRHGPLPLPPSSTSATVKKQRHGAIATPSDVVDPQQATTTLGDKGNFSAAASATSTQHRMAHQQSTNTPPANSTEQTSLPAMQRIRQLGNEMMSAMLSVALVIFSWVIAFVPTWVCRWSDNVAMGAVSIELFYGAVRLQFCLPAKADHHQTHSAASYMDMVDEDEDDFLTTADIDGDSNMGPTKGASSSSTTTVALGEVRRLIQRLELKVAAVEATVVDTRTHLTSLEGVVGGLHYLVERHDESLQELSAAS